MLYEWNHMTDPCYRPSTGAMNSHHVPHCVHKLIPESRQYSARLITRCHCNLLALETVEPVRKTYIDAMNMPPKIYDFFVQAFQL